jgi:hypothetical protein
LIKSGMELGDADRNKHWLDGALDLDKTSMIIRRPYMMTLETRWGGSLDRMTGFLKESQRAGVSADDLQQLRAMIEAERHWLAQRHKRGAAADTDT